MSADIPKLAALEKNPSDEKAPQDSKAAPKRPASTSLAKHIIEAKETEGGQGPANPKKNKLKIVRSTRTTQKPGAKEPEASQPTAAQILKANADFAAFVETFNKKFGEREDNKKTALSILKALREISWASNNGVRVIPDIAKMSWVRKGLFQLYLCEDSEIKEWALRDLIDLLESDPIHMKTAYDLVDLQEKLLGEIQASKAQNLNITLQRLMIKAYATTLECILLHTHSQHLNALEEKIKLSIWDTADNLSNFNIAKDKEIALWTEYATQGAQRIKTEVAEWKKWAHRIICIGSAIIEIGLLAQDQTQIAAVIKDVIEDLKEAFSHFEWHKEWFEEMMLLRKITRLSLLDLGAFQKVTPLFQMKKSDKTNELVLYGAVSTLEHAIKNSPSRTIQEECMKLLIQYMTLENPVIQTRIVQVFTELLLGPEELRNTAYVLLRILEATQYLPNKKVWAEVEKSPQYITLTKDDSQEFKQSIAENIYQNVIKFVIRRIGIIKGEQDRGGHSFATLISSAANETRAKHLLLCLAELSTGFCKQDVHGNSSFHIGVTEKNLALLRNAHLALGCEINAQDFENGNSPLHLAAMTQFTAGAELLLMLGANPSLENNKGEIPLHLAVETGSVEITELLLEKTADINNLNIFGEAPLNIAIKKDNVYLTDQLIKKGARIAECVHQITPIIFAARQNAEKTLIHLIETKEGTLTGLEALEINNMVSRDGESITASENFCRFHLEKMTKDPAYHAAFLPFRHLPCIGFGKGHEITMPVKRKYLVGELSSLNSQKRKPAQHPLLDDFQNTKLILLAKSKEKLALFEKELAEGANPNQQNSLGLNALHVAALYGNTGAVKAIMRSKQARVDCKDIRGFQALHFAAFRRDKEMIQLLLDFNADPNSKNDYGDTPFLIFSGNYPKRAPESLRSIQTQPAAILATDEAAQVFDSMLEDGALAGQADALGNNALHHAVCNGSDAAIEYLYKKFPALAWKKNKKGLFPIEEAVLQKRQLDLKSLLSGKPLNELHEEFISHTANQLTLGNLLARANEAEFLEALLRKAPSLAFYQDKTPFKFTPLHVAAEWGNREIIDVYKKHKLPLDGRDAYANTPAHIACLEEQEGFLNALIGSGADLSLKNQDGRSPLHLAALKGSVANIEALATAAPKLITEKDGNGNSPLHLACKFQRKENVDTLISLAPEAVFALDDDLNTPLHHACFSGDLEIVKTILERGSYLEARNITGETPLSIAALYGHTPIVKYLIEKGADISSKDIEKETPLHKSAYQHHHEIVRALLDAESKRIHSKEDALVNQPNIDLSTPLHELFKIKNQTLLHDGLTLEIMKLLLKADADPFLKNEKGETFFHLMCHQGLDTHMNEAIHLLPACKVKKRFRADDADNKGNTLLHKAVMGNHSSTISLLLHLHASKRKKNKLGETPLFTAIRKGRFKAAVLLHNKGAALDTKNKEEKNIIHALLEHHEMGETEIRLLRWIIKHHPKLLFGKDKDGKTPLHAAAERNHEKVIDILLESLPGSDKENEEYLLEKTAAGHTAQEIAKTNRFDALEMKIRTYSKEKLGSRQKATAEQIEAAFVESGI